jgi:uncharacterized cupredoxin-like copper-binding protein
MRIRALILVVPLAFAACGGASPTAQRAVEIEMRDVAFSPAQLSINRGETIKLVFHNTGAAVHDAFIGDESAQRAHESEMRAMDEDMQRMHSDSHSEAVTVEPGQTATLVHTFNRAGRFVIGCHQPGHYAAGMKIAVVAM